MNFTGCDSIIRGDDWVLPLTFSTVIDGVEAPIDITNWVLVLTVKSNPKAPNGEAAISKTVDTHTAPAEGKTEIRVAGADWDNVLAGDYYYDVEATTDEGEVITILIGRVIFKQDITL